MKRKFKIPVVWQCYGIVEVLAHNVEEASEKILSGDLPLPEGHYLEDSLEVDTEAIPVYNNDV